MSRKLVLIVMLGALAGLAGCSHSCVPPGWYQARSLPQPQRPPGAKPINHSTRYDIPGGPPQGAPSRDEACLVTPPNTLTAAAAASAGVPASKSGSGSSGE